MAFLETHGLGRDFPGVSALNDVDLSIELGRVHVLAGENGAGKSTLVKLLTGTDRPSRGSISIDGKDPAEDPSLFRNIAYVPQELTLFPHLSVAENLFLPYDRTGHGRNIVNRRRLESEAATVLARFGITASPAAFVRTISVPDQQLLQIARASTNKNMKVLILDEPTSSLTSTEVDRVFQVISGFRDSEHAIIFISHKMDEVFSIGDDCTVLRNGEKVEAGHLADTDVNGLIRAMSGETIHLGDTFRPEVVPPGDGDAILTVRGLSGPHFENVDFDLKRGEILGFAGLVGAGRSEVMQTIFGYIKATAGAVEMEGKPWTLGDTAASIRNGMIYLSEERKQHGILPLMSVRDNIGISLYDQTASVFGISARKERACVADIIKAYDIKTSSMGKQIMFLSGGNQQKALIGRAMAQQPRVLIFDEPTKGIDVRTKAEIYRIMKGLAEQGVGIILVSSEMEELRKCATRIVTMHSGKVTGSFDAAGTSNETLVGAIFGKENTPDAA
ncbi:sugar ABC transporter ATP-binding protein [Manganibacter manganicus]|uniref:Sugar ABC transporter ATP-binding protein n=1 Tax=Manganibacter manganicus TaxID=1873176 RepID=A0A1V8RM96_9HYPH|nr:sugar ABC transporter ATP-binding protein [Pseudaminobacter manganicus]OQM74322.1 sugar ABC transporter ATP-binding protein [Pseudaminobacter manganicus]